MDNLIRDRSWCKCEKGRGKGPEKRRSKMIDATNATETTRICFLPGDLEVLEDPRTPSLRRISYGIILPTICFLGIIGNILNLVVLTRRNMRGTAYIYMRGYSAAALLAIFFCIPFALRVLIHKETGRWSNWTQAFYHAHLELFLGNGCLGVQGDAGDRFQSGADHPAGWLQPAYNASLQKVLRASSTDDAVEDSEHRRGSQNVRGGTEARFPFRQHQHLVPSLRQPHGNPQRHFEGEQSQPLPLPGVPCPGQLAGSDQLLDHVLHLLPLLGGFPKYPDPHSALALGKQRAGWKRLANEAFSRTKASYYHNHHHHHSADHCRRDSRSFRACQRLDRRKIFLRICPRPGAVSSTRCRTDLKKSGRDFPFWQSLFHSLAS